MVDVDASLTALPNIQPDVVEGGLLSVEVERRRRRRRQAVAQCCRRTVAFLFSHVGLFGIVVAYSIIGGLMFQALEASYEAKQRTIFGNFKYAKVEAIKILVMDLLRSQKLNKLPPGEWKLNFTDQVLAVFAKFQIEVTEAVRDKGWDGKDGTAESALQWSFPGALLYAVTVITTIGYGHVTPKTDLGRLLTMFYALIGIPLTFLYLSNIGNFLADCFRLFYRRVLCDVCCCRQCERQRRIQRLTEMRTDPKQADHQRCRHRQRRHRQNFGRLRVKTSGGSSALPSTIDELGLEYQLSDNEFIRPAMSEPDKVQQRQDEILIDNLAFEPDDAPTSDTIPFSTSVINLPVSGDVTGRRETSGVPARRAVSLTPQRPCDSRHRPIAGTDVISGSLQSPCYLLSVTSHSTPSSPSHKGLNTVEHADSCVELVNCASNNKQIANNARQLGMMSTIDLANDIETKLIRETDIISDDDDYSLSPSTPSRQRASSYKDSYRSGRSLCLSEDQLSFAALQQIPDLPETDIVDSSDSLIITSPLQRSWHPVLPLDYNESLTVNLPETSEDITDQCNTQDNPVCSAVGITVHIQSDIKHHRNTDDLKHCNSSSGDVNRLPTAGGMPTFLIESENESRSPCVARCSEENKRSQTAEFTTSSSSIRHRRTSLQFQLELNNSSDLRRDYQTFDRPTSMSHEKQITATSDGTCGILSTITVPHDKSRQHISTPLSAVCAVTRVFHRKHNLSAAVGGTTRGSTYGTPSLSKLLHRCRSTWSVRLRQMRDPRHIPASCPSSPKQQPPMTSSVHPDSASVHGASGTSGRRTGRRGEDRRLNGGPMMVTSVGEHATFSNTIRSISCHSQRNRQMNVAVVEDCFQQATTGGDVVDYETVGHAAVDDKEFGCSRQTSAETNNEIIDCKMTATVRPNMAETDKVTVPIFICLIIIVGYIFAGAVLFTLWEDWDYLTGSYFCFITLSTIGFGDIVPGTDENQWASREKLVLCVLWLAFGLSLLAMCFNLMQEQFIEKVRQIGLKLGLVKDELIDADDGNN